MADRERMKVQFFVSFAQVETLGWVNLWQTNCFLTFMLCIHTTLCNYSTYSYYFIMLNAKLFCILQNIFIILEQRGHAGIAGYV